MKRLDPDRGPDAIGELTWYFNEAAADVGLRGQNLTDTGGSNEPGGPTWRQIRAAARQREINDALRRLTMRQRQVLSVCYTGPLIGSLTGGRQMVAKWGEPVGRVLLALGQTVKSTDDALAIVVLAAAVDAHGAYVAARQAQRAEVAEVRQRAIDEAAARRAMLESERKGTRHERAVAAVAAWVREVLV